MRYISHARCSGVSIPKWIKGVNLTVRVTLLCFSTRLFYLFFREEAPLIFCYMCRDLKREAICRGQLLPSKSVICPQVRDPELNLILTVHKVDLT